MGRLTNTVSGNVVSFRSCAGADIESLKCYFEPVQGGSGDPSPSNVRTISGHTQIQTAYKGKNLLNKNDYGFKAYDSLVFGGTNTSEVDGTFILPAGTYTFSANINLSFIFVQYTHQTGSTFASNTNSLTFTCPIKEAIRIGCILNYQDINHDMLQYNYQLELGSITTAYEPYKGLISTIDWTNDAGTIYGGYVDLITGNVYKTWEYFDLYNYRNYFQWVEAYNVFWVAPTLLTGQAKDGFQSLSNIYPYNGAYNHMADKTTGFIYNNNIAIRDDSFEGNLESFKNSIQDGQYIIYELTTPVLVGNLSPIQLQTLIGQNNIWSNTNGQIEVEYDLHETKNIVEAKKRVLLAQPHLATVNDMIAHFNTDLTSPLKECKLNLLPIQEGSGDPNPTNIRQIKGYTNCNIFKSKKNLFNFETGKTKQEYLNNGTFRAIYHTGIISDGQQKFSVSAYPKDSNTLSNVAIHLGYCRDGIIYTYASFISSSGDVTPRIMSLQEGDEITFDLTEDSIWSLETRNLPRYNIQIEIADETTSFESYSGTTIPISWINWNQLIIDGNFTDATKWIPGNTSYGSISISNNIGTWTCTTKPTQYYQTGIAEKDMHLEVPYNHKLLLSAQVKSSVAADVALYAIYGANTHTYPYIDSVEANTWTHIYGFVNQRESDRLITKGKVCYYPSNMSNVDVGTTLEVKNFMMFDLTQIFGTGNEPTAKDFINQFSNDYYEYDLGDTGTGVAPIIYGGYINLTTGEIIKEWEKVMLKNQNWYNYSNFQWFALNINKDKYTHVFCNCFPVVDATINSSLRPNECINTYINGASYANILFFWKTDGNFTNATEFKDWMNALEYDPYVVYKLETPEIIGTLTPQQISTFKGINNIWSNTNGTTEVKYWTY